MKVRALLVLAAVLAITSCEVYRNGVVRGGLKCTPGDRVEITYPVDGGQPTVSRDCLHVERPGNSTNVVVMFVVDQTNAKDTTITFKCQTEASDSADGAADCRTPLVTGNGDPQWVVNVAGNGRPHPVRIAGHLEKCDTECRPGQDQCMMDHCRYEFLVRDSAGQHVPLDPEFITDPK